MKKICIALATATLLASLSTVVYADDVIVRTSVGSGEVKFTETSEKADITADELTELVKNSLKEISKHNTLNGFFDASANISLKLDEENQMPIKAEAIGNIDRYDDTLYANFHYSYDVMGQSDSQNFEAYSWEDGDKTYSATFTDNEWSVTESQKPINDALDELSESLESEEAQKFSLDALQPNLYEEDGTKYYVCIYDKDTMINTAEAFEGAEMYTSMADQIAGDNDVQLVFIINAETGMPRALSINASGASGSLPGELFGAESNIEFSCDDLYATVLLSEDADTIEIPEEVLNTQATTMEDSLTELFGNLEGDLESLDNSTEPNN